ncbi:MAG: alpha/beta hydrolase [Rubrivivax sp.]|nr:MAG: alpha/beta hydrolase [Rubrivivax sp.]
MNAQTEKRLVAGPAGQLEVAIDLPADGAAPLGTALICHPNPTQGGTMDNKVVQTLARAFIQLGWRAVRFNFRGIGKSEGAWDEGRGEVDDALAVLAAVRAPDEALILSVGPATSRFDTAPVPADTVVIHGEVDDVVPLSAVLDWARPQSLPVTVVPGVGHFFHGQLPLLKSLVVRAFDPRKI